jgi:alkylation response protein AidB-like acyl-CoA dehydrogenase
MNEIRTGQSVLAALKELKQQLSERAVDIESAGRIPADLHAQLGAIGVYRLLTPRSHGGLQADIGDVLDVIETLATIDGSLAWATVIGIQSPSVLSWLPKDVFDALYASTPDVTVGGAFAPQGRAEVVEGGYRISGRWAFGSGCDNWDYLFGNCVIIEGGGPVPGPDGKPAMRAMLFSRDRAKLLDTWHTLGMRGTGSKDFVVEDLFVPRSHSFDPMTAAPCVDGIFRYPLIEFGNHLAMIAIGVAQGALNDLVPMTAGRQRVFSSTAIAADPVVHHRIGKVETALRAARSLLREQALREREVDEGADAMQLMAVASANNAWVLETCTAVVDACFQTNGARGIYNQSSLQRRLRDIYTIGQHATLNDTAWTRWGAGIFGQGAPLPPG